MILYFALKEQSIAASRQEIEAAIRSAYPLCEVHEERSVAAFGVSLSLRELEAEAVRAHIVILLAERGIFVEPCSREALMPFASLLPQKPQKPQKRERRGVSLTAFLITIISLVLVFSLSLALVLGAFLRTRHLGVGEQQSEDYVGKIAAIDAIFKNYYYEDINGQAQLDAMLKAYAAASGDRYAAYYTAEEYAQMLAENNGSVVGIGITALEDETTGGILVLEVLQGSPAAGAGLMPGDVIVAVHNGEVMQRVTEIGYTAAVALLRGEKGSIAQFSALRDGAELSFSVVRDTVETQSVSGSACLADPTVGFVRISGFDTVTPRQFKDVMNALIAGGCNKFVFDMRGNPGGDLKSVNAILSYFLQIDQLMVSVVTKEGKVTEHRVRAVSYSDDYEPCSVLPEEIGMYRGYPLAVLTNGRTASAAELFTAALRDYELATVVGETTYGKGVLQGVYTLAPWGYEGAVKLTTGYYNPPCGINYDGVGIVPHVAVSLSEAAAKKSLYLLSEQEDDQRLRAIDLLIATN